MFAVELDNIERMLMHTKPIVIAKDQESYKISVPIKSKCVSKLGDASLVSIIIKVAH